LNLKKYDIIVKKNFKIQLNLEIELITIEHIHTEVTLAEASQIEKIYF
jgi:hypothetical protein